VIRVDLGVVEEKASRAYLMTWMRAYDREIEYGGEAVAVVPRDPKGFSSVIKDSVYFRRFAFDLVERTPRTGSPTSWTVVVPTWINMGQTDVWPFGDTTYTFESLP
jgi:hypothetical protein